jgi:hypothetical protein
MKFIVIEIQYKLIYDLHYEINLNLQTEFHLDVYNSFFVVQPDRLIDLINLVKKYN